MSQKRWPKENIYSGAAIVCAALILLIPVLLNGFPFIFPDSGDYLVFTPRIYRSPYYGLFIFFFHMNRWIWMPVIAQALIVSHLLWLMLKLNGARRVNRSTIVLAMLLTVFSSLPYFVGFIMADIFTPIMFITMYILAFYYAELSWPLRIYLILLTCIATAAHISNLTMGLGILFLFFALLAWRGLSWIIIWQRIGILLIPIGLTIYAFLLYNSLIFGILSLGPAGPSFFMANLIEHGPARTYLEKVCPEAGYKICTFKNRLPQVADSLLWNSEVFQKLGGFAGMEQESKTIIAATIRRYPLEVIEVTAKNFISGLMTHETASDLQAKYQVPWVIDTLMIKFGPHAVEKYLNSAEMRDTIPHHLLKTLDDVVIPVAFIVLIGLGLFAARRSNRQNAILAMTMLTAVLGDTLLCTAISGVHDRYQARVTWLLPMAVFVIFSSLAAKSNAHVGKKKIVRPKGIK